jgi:hypothetical protein
MDKQCGHLCVTIAIEFTVKYHVRYRGRTGLVGCSAESTGLTHSRHSDFVGRFYTAAHARIRGTGSPTHLR